MTIEIEVRMGCGDKPMANISDDLISSDEMAAIRGRQELLDQVVIRGTRSLELPHTPGIDLGFAPTITVSELDIFGEHQIESFSINVTEGTIYDSVEVTQVIGTLLEGPCP